MKDKNKSRSSESNFEIRDFRNRDIWVCGYSFKRGHCGVCSGIKDKVGSRSSKSNFEIRDLELG